MLHVFVSAHIDISIQILFVCDASEYMKHEEHLDLRSALFNLSAIPLIMHRYRTNNSDMIL